MHDIKITLEHNPYIAEYTLHGKKLNPVASAKYLGINFDSKLTFNHHVNTQYYINKLEAVQKHAACFIVSDYRRLSSTRSSISHIPNSLKLKSIVYHHTRLRLLMFYKIVNHLVDLD